LGVLEAIIAIAGAVTAIFGIFKLASWHLTKTPEEKAEDIAKEVKKEQDEFEKTGRPKWD